MSEAGRKIGGLNNCIHKACLSDSHMAYGFLWVFKKDYNPLISYGYINKNYVPVVCLNNDGGYISEYQSITEAQNVTGADGSAIIRCCKGKQKTAQGFKWKYKKDWEEIRGAKDFESQD